jgi:hypothetical protein
MHWALTSGARDVNLSGARREHEMSDAQVERGSRFAVRGSRFAVRGSRFAVRGSRFAVRGSRFAVR